MAELKTRIQLRHDTEANWQSVAETLIPLEGEACLTTDGLNIVTGKQIGRAS